MQRELLAGTNANGRPLGKGLLEHIKNQFLPEENGAAQNDQKPRTDTRGTLLRELHIRFEM